MGAGHGGLGVAARLKAKGRDPIIVDASSRVGDTWRGRWASLRLFTPRFVDGLPGMPFPDGDDPFPGKDEVADYQQAFAAQLGVPIRLGAVVRRIRPAGNAFEVSLDGETLRARNVVVATGAHQTPRIPPFAARLDPSVVQLHSRDYGRSGALPDGPVLVVGARNSGAEIAVEVARTHATTVALGTQPPVAPPRWRSTRWWRVAQLRNWLLRGRILPGPLPWPLKPPGYLEVDLERAQRDGVLRLAPRAVDAAGADVHFADGTTTHPRTVIWATGFRNDDTWIDVPSGEEGIPVGKHRRGPVGGLWIVRATLLGSLHWGALDVASDIARQGHSLSVPSSRRR